MEFRDYIQSHISDSTIKTELERSYPYYRHLTPELKQRFINRCSAFIELKKFAGRQGLVISDPVRIIITACAVQVTFGLDSFTLDTFEYVLVYPDVYESPATGQLHKGETSMNGFICFSWKHILEGIEDQHDNYNLGLHEWTHALRFNSIKYEVTDYFFDGYINKWIANAVHEFTRLKNGRQSIFRRYGATNIHEFFSVCIEHFFESPEEFRTKLPDLFNQTCILLNQVPAKEQSAQINVRNQLMELNNAEQKEDQPLYSLEASLYRTLMNFGSRIIYFGLVLFILLLQHNKAATILAFFLCLFAVFMINNEYFTIRFYANHIYLQKGFINSLSTQQTVNYYSLIKMEIYEGNNDEEHGFVFELKYYDGSRFIKRRAYSNSVRIPEEEIKTLMQQKNVTVLFPSFN
ncbi:MAG: hypothetical protein JWP12_1150 [Bacteroidetes bacterium]|nr:hypothetical protein [Bacteroidota bacterium]